jgi:hypothetical protein
LQPNPERQPDVWMRPRRDEPNPEAQPDPDVEQ